MPTIKFTDGVEFDATGPYRVVRKSDGYYVVGQGMLCPVGDRREGDQLVADLNRSKTETGG